MTGTDSHISGPRSGFVPEWDGTAYAANTAHHRAFDDGFLATTPSAARRSGARPRLRQRRPHGDRGGDRRRRRARRRRRRPAVDARGGAGPRPARTSRSSGAGAGPRPRLRAGARRHLRRGAQPGDAALGAGGRPARRLPQRRPAAPSPAAGSGSSAAAPATSPSPVALLDDVSARLGGPSCPWNFADPATALDWLEAGGLDAVTDAAGLRPLRRPAPGLRRGRPCIGWLHSQVLHAYEAGPPGDARTPGSAGPSRTGSTSSAAADGTFDQTWVRLDLLARRP